MKNSKLLGLVLLIGCFLTFLILLPMILINGILIIIGGISLFYFIFCIIEFRSEKYTNIINSNNNIIEIFVNWLDNLPQIIKKKKKWYCYEYWRPNIPANGCKQQCEWCKIKQNES